MLQLVYHEPHFPSLNNAVKLIPENSIVSLVDTFHCHKSNLPFIFPDSYIHIFLYTRGDIFPIRIRIF